MGNFKSVHLMGAVGIMLIVAPFLAGYSAPFVALSVIVGLLIVASWIYILYYNYMGPRKDRFSKNK